MTAMILMATELLRRSRKLSLVSCMPDSEYNPETRLRIFVVCRSIASVTAAGEGGNGMLEGTDKEFRLGVLTIEVILLVIEASGSELEGAVLRADRKKTQIDPLTLRPLLQHSSTFSEPLSSLMLLTSP